MTRTLLSRIFIALLVLLVAGCAAPTPEEAVSEEAELRVSLITPSPLGDQGFIDIQASGFEQALEELPIEGQIIQTKGAEEHEATLRGAAGQGFDLIILSSMNPDMVIGVAEEYPDVRFAAIDMFFTVETPSNLSSVIIELPETE